MKKILLAKYLRINYTPILRNLSGTAYSVSFSWIYIFFLFWEQIKPQPNNTEQFLVNLITLFVLCSKILYS